tara:strand:- start:346 stop:594 length:249 start_codon:yes stop_codon:yes gene_type:complete
MAALHPVKGKLGKGSKLLDGQGPLLTRSKQFEQNPARRLRFVAGVIKQAGVVVNAQKPSHKIIAAGCLDLLKSHLIGHMFVS